MEFYVAKFLYHRCQPIGPMFLFWLLKHIAYNANDGKHDIAICNLANDCAKKSNVADLPSAPAKSKTPNTPGMG